MCGKSDDHEVPTVTKVVHGLRVRGAGGCGDNGGVRALPARRVADVLHEVLRLLEVNPLLRAELHDELPLLLAGVWGRRCQYVMWGRREQRTDGEDAEPHCVCVLDCQVAESSARAWERDPVADVEMRIFDGAVYGDSLPGMSLVIATLDDRLLHREWTLPRDWRCSLESG